MRSFSSFLIAIIAVMLVMDGASAAKWREMAVSRDIVTSVCGRGSRGCSWCNALKCYSMGCTKKYGCKALVFPTEPSVRTKSANASSACQRA